MHKFSINMPARIENLEAILNLLVEEKGLHEEILKEIEPKATTKEERIEVIRKKKVITEMTHEITSKREFLNSLNSKRKEDEKEFKKNLAEANTRYKIIVDEAEKFIEEVEEEKGSVTHGTNFLNFSLNALILAHDEKDEGKKVFYYNALKKELNQQKENRKKLQEQKAEKVKETSEGPEVALSVSKDVEDSEETLS